MILRIFFKDSVKDYILKDKSQYTLGSHKSDDFIVTGSSIQKRHIVFNKTLSGWQFECNKNCSVSLHGKTLEKSEIDFSGQYLLSEKDKVSFICINEDAIQYSSVDIKEDTISIGRLDDNSVIINSSYVSRHHAKITREDTHLSLCDLGSTMGTFLNGQAISESRINPGDEIIIGHTSFMVGSDNSLTVCKSDIPVNIKNVIVKTRNYDEIVKYKCAPRIQSSIPERNIEIESPPQIDSKPDTNWLSIVLPSLVTIIVSVLATVLMSNLMMLLYSLPLTLVGVVTSLLNYRKQIKNYNSQENTLYTKYEEYLNSTKHTIENLQREQKKAMLDADPDISECFAIADRLDGRLWNRRYSDKDFLNFRVGKGELPSCVQIYSEKQAVVLKENELLKRANALSENYKKVSGLPIVCNLVKNQVCGIVGSKENCINVLNTIMVQLTTNHNYYDLRAALVFNKSDFSKLSWMNLLPHLKSEDNNIVNSVSDKAECSTMLKSFSELLKNRKILMEEENTFGMNKMLLPYYLFVFAEPSYLSRNDSITEYIFNNQELNAGSIMLVDSVSQLPKECNLIIEVTNQKEGFVYNKNEASNKMHFEIDKYTQDDLNKFALSLANVVCDEAVSTTSIPSKYGFYEMHGIADAESFDVAKSWAESDIINSLSGVLGIGEDDKKIFLDLHEKGHGPHGLVAGTTGSGKSEVLQSYIMSLAMNYHPYELGFVIIDFKGGGMANQFASLPHMLGAITNIDGKEINRSLLSIKAELMKRQRVFADAGVNDISSYMEKYKAGKVSIPIPHLVIIVDEFAELKADQPEFMAELISAARIGRSLGIHLILATQKPAGQVNEQIWSNSKFKICLKVATREDSTEVIKSPLAYTIKEPGRAYLQVGNNELFELFQSGYSGVKLEDENGNTITQLEAMIRRINDYCESEGIKKLPNICLPSLSYSIDFDQTIINCSDTGIIATIGKYDDPYNQIQDNLCINLSKENVMIIGATQTGKTNLLQTLLRSVSDRYSSDRVNFYIIDCASGILSSFSNLNHCGGVVTSNEEEKMENLFKLLQNEVAYRKEKISKSGVSSFASYCEAGFTDLPQIVVLIDNMTALQELYEYTSDIILGLCREGLAVGLSFVVANSQTAGIGYKFFMNFSRKIAFYCNDDSEYSSLFGRSRFDLNNIPGRCITDIDNTILESQVYIAFSGDKEIDRVNNIKSYIAERNQTNTGAPAKIIPLMPEIIDEAYLKNNNYDAAVNNYLIPIGIDYLDMGLYHIDLLKYGALAISGREQSGKTNLVYHILSSIKKNIFTNITTGYILDGLGELKECEDFGFVEAYSQDVNDSKVLLNSMYETLQNRKSTLPSNKTLLSEALENEPLLLLVISGKEMLNSLLSDKASADRLNEIVNDLRRFKAFVLIADLENNAISYSSAAILKYIKESNNLIILENVSDIKITDIPLRLQKEFNKDIKVGDAYSLINGKMKKLHLILADKDE